MEPIANRITKKMSNNVMRSEYVSNQRSFPFFSECGFWCRKGVLVRWTMLNSPRTSEYETVFEREKATERILDSQWGFPSSKSKITSFQAQPLSGLSLP